MLRTTGRAAAAALLLVAGSVVGVAHAAPPPSPPPGPKTTIDADGTYPIGAGIAPGTYSSAGPTDKGPCYWRRTSGDKVVDNALSKKSQVVQIEATDTAFTTKSCQAWQLVECPPTCPAPDRSPLSILGDLGSFIVPRQGSGPPASNP